MSEPDDDEGDGPVAPEPADEPGDGPGDEPGDEPGRLALPSHRPAAGPAAQVATVAAAVVVLVVVALVFVLQGGKESPARKDAASASTAVPEVPPSDFEPTLEPSLAPPPLSFPTELCAEGSIQTPFTVLSFNIHSAIRKNGGLDVGRVIAEIKAWKPDLVLMQEVDNRRGRSGNVVQAQQIGEALGMSWVAGSGQTGNALLSKFPLVEQRIIALPRAGGRFDRHAVHAVVDIAGTDVSVYSTHFEHTSATARLAQAQALARALAADGRPKIVGGDLNSQFGSAPVGTLRAAGLGDAWAAGDGVGNTAPGANPRVRIDFVLHDAFFTPVQSAVLASGVSDHRAVWSRLQLNEKLGCIKVGS